MNSLSPHLVTPSEPPLILSDDKEADLMIYVQMMLDQRWLIFFITLAITCAGTLYALLARPIYEASLMVHVEEKSQREPKNILGEAGSMRQPHERQTGVVAVGGDEVSVLFFHSQS